jgi:hypothetical protein
MNAKNILSAGLLITQLVPQVAADAECARLLERLLERLSVLMSSDGFDLQKGIDAILSDPLPSSEQLKASFSGLISTMASETGKHLEKKIKYIEMTDTYRDYVKALEERTVALAEELQAKGADLSKYPSLSKPGV